MLDRFSKFFSDEGRCKAAAEKGSILRCGGRADPRCGGGNCTAHCNEFCFCGTSCRPKRPASPSPKKGA